MENDKEPLKRNAFFIEAAIDERGPQMLKIVPSFNQYLVYYDDSMCSCIQLNEDGEWEQIDGSLNNGVIAPIGLAIARASGA